MPATLTQVVKQFQQDWTAQLAPDAILKVCHDVGYVWRERCLDPVTTTPLFFVQVVHGNTSCTHLRHLTKLKVSASASCQARTRLPLEVFEETVASQELVTPDKRRDPASKVRLKLAIRSWTFLMTLGTDSGQTTPKTLATSVIEDMRGLGSCGSRCHVIARRDDLAQS